MPVAYNNRQDVLTAIQEANQRRLDAYHISRLERDFIRILRTDVLPLFPVRKKLPKQPSGPVPARRKGMK